MSLLISVYMGSQHKNADALSRIPARKCLRTDCTRCTRDVCHVNKKQRANTVISQVMGSLGGMWWDSTALQKPFILSGKHWRWTMVFCVESGTLMGLVELRDLYCKWWLPLRSVNAFCIFCTIAPLVAISAGPKHYSECDSASTGPIAKKMSFIGVKMWHVWLKQTRSKEETG